jgi:hypothetical protein
LKIITGLLTLLFLVSFNPNLEKTASAKISDFPEDKVDPELLEAAQMVENYLKVNYPDFVSGDVHIKKDEINGSWTFRYTEDIVLIYDSRSGEVHPK